VNILWQNVFEKNIPFTSRSDFIWKGMNKVLSVICSPGNNIYSKWLYKSAQLSWFPFFELLNNVKISECVVKALKEKKTIDAVVIGCFGDPCVYELRNLLEIPVIGLSEASYNLATLMGKKLAVVTVWDGFVPLIEGNIVKYGCKERCISNRPVRHFNLDWDELVEAFNGNSNNIVGKFESVARKCIDDGADVVIAGCAYLGGAFTLNNYKEILDRGIPVIDPLTAGILSAEYMIKLNKLNGIVKSGSKMSPFSSPPGRWKAKIIEDFFGGNAN